MIKVDNLTVRYGETEAVKKLNLTIGHGEKVSIVGRSGCGKTSFLHAVGALIESYEGSISINSNMGSGSKDDIAIVLQKDGLFPWKTVAENVELALINQDFLSEEKKKRVDSALEELGVFDQKDKYLHEISGGQRQRAAIARALVIRPKVLLMDEPTGSLDMITKETFQDRLHQLYEDHDMTTVLVTHDIEEAVYLGQRILVMDQGEIVAQIDNGLYDQNQVRDSIDFYEMCLKVRKVMTL